MKLYRGTKKHITDTILPNAYLEAPRKPTDTHPAIHEQADLWFFKKFKIKARSQTIFVSTCKKQANTYSGDDGAILEIEPIGDYKLIYSAYVYDFLDHTFDGICGARPEEITKWLDSKYYYCVKSISELPKDFLGEAMLFCEEYKVTQLPE
ncbi:hypothetical protein BCS71_01340 [Vibrio lentus]|uniref:hypothetical protein n=1 Tax=Vibrio lentus TaxID=136468 RepID=UPI000C851E7D|nr:hypothetical protein [Vibrio lentus]PMI56311.1 hypothetical protein BCU41_11325 [Vibrio lentus]